MQSAWDPFAWRLLQDWLIRYIAFRTRTPEVIDRLKARSDEFESVPVPKGIIDQLMIQGEPPPEIMGGFMGLPDMDVGLTPKPKGGASMLPPSFDPRMFNQWVTDPEAGAGFGTDAPFMDLAREYKQLVDVVRQFGRALEAGDIEGVLELVSEDYRDVSGRSKTALADAIGELFRVTRARRVMFVHAEQLEPMGDRMAGIASGAWEAEVVDDRGAELKSEFFRLELIFARDERGEWRISSIRHVQA
jgi:hypothetical protein